MNETDDNGEDHPQQRLRLSWGGATHQGQVRPVNQDALHAEGGLFVVADGMGGHQAGEVASRITVKTLAGRDHASIDDLVDSAVAANTAVWTQSSTGEEFKGMGTTLTALAVIGDGRPPRLGLVNVGDSRVYRRRGDQFEQLTDDHSYVAELVRRGQISDVEAETHPYRNMLTRAIGVAESVEVDRWELTPEAGDVYLLCSDGLINEVPDDDIVTILDDNEDATEAARELIARANQSGGRDNITVVLVAIEVEEVPDVAAPSAADASPMDTGVISSVMHPTPETAEMQGLSEDLAALEADLVGSTAVIDAATIEAAAALGVIDDEASNADILAGSDDEEAALDPPSRPEDALAAFDLPHLEGDETALPWLTEPDPETDSESESEPSEVDIDPDPDSADISTDLERADAATHDADLGSETAPLAATDPATEAPTVVETATTTQPISPFVDPVTVSGPVDHFAPEVRGWKAPVAVTWRSLLFVTVVIAIIVAAGGLVAWYARSAYYVGYSGDEVVIYQGRPDGVLWFDPTLEETTGVFRQDLSESIAVEVEMLFETGTLDGARAFVEQIRPQSAAAAETSGSDPPSVDEGTTETSTTTLP